MKKRGRTDIMNDKLRLYELLKNDNLHGVLVDAAVWVVCGDNAVRSLDYICLGNLDGGHQMTDHLKTALESLGVDCSGTTATVRFSLDEAFFVHYALNALHLYEMDINAENTNAIVRLDTRAAWKRFSEVRPDYPLIYATYHHFRGKGWLARTGLQYGADFTLYQKHPALCHSDYSVLIQTPDAATSTSSLGPMSRPPATWHTIQITNRLTTQVGKRLLIVNIHDNRPELGYDDHKCLDRLEVSEYLVRRWVPERGRSSVAERPRAARDRKGN
jgi:hypothetical protein